MEKVKEVEIEEKVEEAEAIEKVEEVEVEEKVEDAEAIEKLEEVEVKKTDAIEKNSKKTSNRQKP
ncbi:hypothetical protein M9458_056209 [Cirrhinus mrigala]|uniref:Uncharacterized protein n=1 Tax=Cirrhinus mrigala TaxID=683832 RepID=A0ABD0ME08_CIRMR